MQISGYCPAQVILCNLLLSRMILAISWEILDSASSSPQTQQESAKIPNDPIFSQNLTGERLIEASKSLSLSHPFSDSQFSISEIIGSGGVERVALAFRRSWFERSRGDRFYVNIGQAGTLGGGRKQVPARALSVVWTANGAGSRAPDAAPGAFGAHEDMPVGDRRKGRGVSSGAGSWIAHGGAREGGGRLCGWRRSGSWTRRSRLLPHTGQTVTSMPVSSSSRCCQSGDVLRASP